MSTEIKATFENKNIQVTTEQKNIAVQFSHTQGIPGKSAYEIAVQNGFEGTETERLASLQGGGNYSHTQSVASNTRTITHNLGFNPNYIAVDSGGDQIIGSPSRPDTNTLVLTFSASTGGKAYLS